MKRIILPLIVLLSACTSIPKTTFTEGNTEYNSETAEVRISYPIVTSDNETFADSINRAIKFSILSQSGNDYSDSLDTGNSSPESSSFDDIIAQAKTFEKDSIPYSNVVEWQAFQNQKLVSIYLEHYLFAGGAHGSTVISTLTFDKATGKELNIASHIKDTARFRQLLISEYTVQNGLDVDVSTGGIGYFTELRDLPIPATLLLNNRGLVVIYQQYEIACYAVGITSATIPFESLHGLIDLDVNDLIPVDTEKEN